MAVTPIEKTINKCIIKEGITYVKNYTKLVNECCS